MPKFEFQETPPFGPVERAGAAGPWLLSAREELGDKKTRTLQELAAGPVRLEVRQGRQALWLVASGLDKGGFAFRMAWAPDGLTSVKRHDEDGETVYQIACSLGAVRVRLRVQGDAVPVVHWTTELTPEADTLVPFWPRDVYPLDDSEDPMGAAGTVYAVQRNTCGGMLYASLTEPVGGSLLYLQDLTSLNDYCIATHTVPDSVVGGEWPELGFSLPPTDAGQPLPKGKTVGISDALVRFSPIVPENDRECARLFFDMLSDIYPHLDRPETTFHDWPKRAEQAARDLSESPLCTVESHGHTYIQPYVDAEDPDSLTQINIVKDLREYGRWSGREIPLAEKLAEGIPVFYKKDVGSLGRYLPGNENLPENKEGDSWYLYVPLGGLAFMAKHGDEEARRMFCDSLDYAVKVGRHFEYRWPVQFDPKTLDVIVGGRKPGDPGESDVGGVYAYVMMDAYEFTRDVVYLEEAKKGIRALDGLGFRVGYQFNLTAWAAAGALRVWKATGDVYYKDISYVLLASFFHNTFLWTSRLGAARYFPSFLGLSCLHDGKYKATYEEHDAFTALHEYLTLGRGDIAPSVRLFVTEFCRRVVDQLWYAYPSELPEEEIAKEPKNGRIERNLAIPLEDLYVGWEKAGTVGQEVYGAGAPMAFTARCWHRMEDTPFIVYCDIPLGGMERPFKRTITVNLLGEDGYPCRLRLIPEGRKKLPPVRVSMRHGAANEDLEGDSTDEGHLEYAPMGECSLTITW